MTIKFPFFSDSEGVKLNGDAFLTGAKQGHHLRLTPADPDQAGSAFTRRKVLDSRRSFKTRFKISLETDGTSGDGMAFVLHRDGKGKIGDGGGGLGYGGIDPSVAVEIDTFYNADNDNEPVSDHYAVVVDGAVGDARVAFEAPFPLAQHVTMVWVQYKSKQKRLKVFGAGEGAAKPTTPFINVRANLRNLFDGDPVRAGFTAATAAAYQRHDVVSWKLKQRR